MFFILINTTFNTSSETNVKCINKTKRTDFHNFASHRYSQTVISVLRSFIFFIWKRKRRKLQWFNMLIKTFPFSLCMLRSLKTWTQLNSTKNGQITTTYKMLGIAASGIIMNFIPLVTSSTGLMSLFKGKIWRVLFNL